MSRMLHYFLKHFQWPPIAPGGSTQHERDMEGIDLDSFVAVPHATAHVASPNQRQRHPAHHPGCLRPMC